MRTYILILALSVIIFSCQEKDDNSISKEEAIAESIKLKLIANNDISENIRLISDDNNYDFDEIDFKSNLGQYFGNKGLNKISTPDIREFSEQIQGVWKLDYRSVSGERMNSSEWIINKPKKSENYASIESLTLSKESLDDNSDKLLASYGIITLKTIRGPEKRLPKGTNGILQVFDYTLLGKNYEGFNGTHKGLAEFVWIKQNGEYRAVIGSIKITDMEGNIIMDDNSNCIVLNATPNSYSIQYPNIKGFDSYQKIKKNSELPLTEAWGKMKNDTDFINPTEWKDFLNN